MKIRTTSVIIAALGVSGIALISCGEKDKGSGGSIGAPQAYPPTAQVTPGSLLASSGTGSGVVIKTRKKQAINLTRASQLMMANPVEPSTGAEKLQMMETVKTRLFSRGPTNMLELVKGVDRRMSEYDSRVAQMSETPACLSSTPVDVSSTFTVPAASGTTTFPLFGQCQETLSPGLTLMFGKKDNDWYLVDGSVQDLDGSDACVMTMAKISGTSDADRVVDAYMAVIDHGKTNNFAGSSALMHFRADVAAGTLELTAGGVGIGAEQIHAKSNASHVYVQLQAGASGSTGTLYHACFSATDLSNVALANCSTLKDSLELVSLGTKAAGQYVGPGGQSINISPSEANNVDLTTVAPAFCGKLETAFSSIPAFGG